VFARGTILRGWIAPNGLVGVQGAQDLTLRPNEWELVLSDEEILDWTVRDPAINPDYRPEEC
jgi:hypothetical protein